MKLNNITGIEREIILVCSYIYFFSIGLIYILLFNFQFNLWYNSFRVSKWSVSSSEGVSAVPWLTYTCTTKVSIVLNFLFDEGGGGWETKFYLLVFTLAMRLSYVSYCKFWIYWVGINTKFTYITCHIVNFVFTPTQWIQHLQYDKRDIMFLQNATSISTMIKNILHMHVLFFCKRQIYNSDTLLENLISISVMFFFRMGEGGWEDWCSAYWKWLILRFF